MAKRGLIAAWALFYALQASWVLYAGVDALFTAASTMTGARPAGDAPCCAGSCGCSWDARARETCCCDPKSATSTNAASGRFSAIEAARCVGVEAAIAKARTQPVLPVSLALLIVPHVDDAPFLPDLRLPQSPEACRIDKVPIL